MTEGDESDRFVLPPVDLDDDPLPAAVAAGMAPDATALGEKLVGLPDVPTSIQPVSGQSATEYAWAAAETAGDVGDEDDEVTELISTPSRVQTWSETWGKAALIVIPCVVGAVVGCWLFVASTPERGAGGTTTSTTVRSSIAEAPSLPWIPEEAPSVVTTAPPTVTVTAAPPPTVVDPDAIRITNTAGGFSFILPSGWVESDPSHLDYGSALLSKTVGARQPGQPVMVANDARIILGRLDKNLYASAEATNDKAAARLAADMGEYFMPYPGTRINPQTIPVATTGGLAGTASYYEVKFNDASKPVGEIWVAVVGSPAGSPPQRWFVLWLGTSNKPVDKAAALALAESIQPD